ncbi:MAG: esterase/lipase family protein [Woeseiaceae bacterium]
MRDDVVFVHGIWMPGGVMAWIRQYLEREYGFRGHLFSYASVRETLDDNAALLADFVSGLDAAKVHLIGHSLGGVVSLRMLAQFEEAPAGRVVCLGSPLCGSLAASSVSRYHWGSSVLGKALVAGVLDEPASRWAAPVTGRRDVGVIAGTRAMGFGRLMTTFNEESDGTVAVSETRLPGARDHLTMPVTHMGMVMSRNVADQAAAFLQRGEFLRDA